ncbi:MAG: ribonuclease D [Limisphaerales bacterium]
MIDTAERLADFLPRLRAADWIALDTEADSLHAYPAKLCLLQFSIPGADVLVDPLADLDLAPLWDVLRGRELLLHGSDYDLRLLREHHDFVPHRMFDTMIAARLLGVLRFGLQDLVGTTLGVALEKGPQKADWAQRPLTERMENYARNDTRYLHPLVTKLREQLVAKGRLGWCEESCAALVAECAVVPPPDPEREWRLKGSAKLTREELAVLRELWHWREKEAVRCNRPPFFLLSHDTLLDLAIAAVDDVPLDPLLPRRFAPLRREAVLRAVARGLHVPPAECPPKLRGVSYHPTDAEHARFNRLKSLRDRRAAQQGIDPTLIASKQTLELLSRKNSEPEKLLLKWQRELMSH